MTKNPLVNAIAATAYITLVASFLFYGTKAIGPVDGLIVPVAMLSLFVLSAAMMGYLFLYQPLQLFFEGRQKEAAKLFVETVGIFACITVAIFLALFLIPISSGH
jgi:hypothetical protein